MVLELSADQELWVDETLNSMTLKECIGQMLMPHHPLRSLQSDFMAVQSAQKADWLSLLEEIPLGGICLRQLPSSEAKKMISEIQSASRIPVLIGGDVELGISIGGLLNFEDAEEMPDYGALTPPMMGFAAADKPELTYEVCRIIARQRRAFGYHWTFSPVVDLNMNFRNSITNVRSLGDDPEIVIRHSLAFIQGIQENGLMAATSKHFPGDGYDDRDQHHVTTINGLAVSDWWNSYGRVWQASIDEGVNAVMIGHIAFPNYVSEIGSSDPSLPATLSADLQVKLLREELGFRGVVVTDGSFMGGLVARVNPEDRAVSNIEAGADICLLPETIYDFKMIEKAVTSGRLKEDRIRESARRILEMKARLRIHESPFMHDEKLKTPYDPDQIINSVAESCITTLRSGDSPVSKPVAGEKVFFVNVFSEGPFSVHELDVAADALRSRGIDVEQIQNPPDSLLMDRLSAFDVIFVNICHIPSSGTFGQVGAGFGQIMWSVLHMYHPRVIYTCFGTPYILNDLPYVPNMLLAYGATHSIQIAITKVWTEEIEIIGQLPVTEAQNY